MEENQYRIVLLDNPFQLMSIDIVQSLFARVIDLKREGYCSDYSGRTLPVGTCDFHATHFLVCEQIGNQLIPVIGNKGTHKERCDYHRIDFPVSPLVRKTNSECAENILKMHQEQEERGEDSLYLASWTAKKNMRGKRTLLFLRELFVTAMVGYKMHYRPRAQYFTCGMLRMRTDRFCQTLGFRPVTDSSLFKHPQLDLDEAIMMQLFDFSDYAQKVFEKNREHWDQRIAIGRDFISNGDELHRIIRQVA